MTHPFAPAPGAAAAEPMHALHAWAGEGWLRHLDVAFADFVTDLCPQSPPLLALAAALLAHLEGQGHSCLPLDELLGDTEALLAWPAPALGALRSALGLLPCELTAWQHALGASPLVEVLPSPAGAERQAEGAPPLVLCGSRLYLRRYWRWEREVAAQVQQRCAARAAVDEDAARRWLGALFPAAGGGARGTGDAGPDWQQVACAVALRAGLSVITGGPGTGKTYTAARLLALLLATHAGPQPLRVALAAPTGKAAARLRQAMGDAMQGLQAQWAHAGLSVEWAGELAAQAGTARTLHALLGARPDTRRFAFGPARTLPYDVLIVDEASMVHLEMMAAVLGALPPHARVVLLGDKDQLASVEAGAVLGELCRDAEFGHYGQETAAFVQRVAGQDLPPDTLGSGSALAQQTVMLRHSHRFGGAIGALALAVNAGDLARAAQVLCGANAALDWLQGVPAGAVVDLALGGRSAGGEPDAGAASGYASPGGYLDLLRQRPPATDAGAFEAWAARLLAAFERSRVLCAVRAGAWGTEGLNAAIEQALVARGWLARGGPWYEGRPVMVTRNDPAAGVFNGDIGIVLRAPLASSTNDTLRAYFLDGGRVRSVSVGRLNDVETAFAMTVHKAQGSEFGHAVLVLPHEPSRVLTRELVYTAVTRARSAFTLVSGRPQALHEALARRTRRAGGLREMLEARANDDAQVQRRQP